MNYRIVEVENGTIPALKKLLPWLVLMGMPEIIYLDQDVLVVNKPTHLLCVPGLSHPENLLDNIRVHHPNVKMIHRLDMATSGLVVFALNHASQKHISKQFETRTVAKQYQALVTGMIHSLEGEINKPLICDWPNRPKQKVDWDNGKKAITQYKVLKTDSRTNRTLLSLHPITGRSHQLRVHCLSIGHPIEGDALYAPESKAERLMLHAERICFAHPSTDAKIDLYCPAPFSL